MNEITNLDKVVEIEEIQSNSNFTPLMQTKSAYSTAVQVIKPRHFPNIIRRCEEEASIGGDDFYYSWRQGKEIIEGVSIQGALAIARNWGNTAVEVTVEETPTAYLFKGCFIDLETGFNLVRPYRQNKQSPKKKDGTDIYTGERGTDIVFQIGASKAMRNVVLNAIPKWLTEKVLDKAKANITAKISQLMKEGKAVPMVVSKLAELGIPLTIVETDFGKKEGWDIVKLVQISGAIKGIKDGTESAENFFPSLRAQPAEQKEIVVELQRKTPDEFITEPKSKKESKTPPVKPTKNVPVESNGVVEPENHFVDRLAGIIKTATATKTRAELKEFIRANSSNLANLNETEWTTFQEAITEHETKIS